MSSRRVASVLLACATGLVVAGCATTVAGTGTPAAAPSGVVLSFPSLTAASSSTPATSSAAPTTRATTSAPRTTATTATTKTSTAPDLGPFRGEWSGHGRSMAIDSFGRGSVVYRAYTMCSANPTPPCDQQSGNSVVPGGKLTFLITSVSGDPANARATATIVSSNDPQYRGSWPMTYSGNVITTPMGTFCNNSSPQGACGA